MTIRLRGHMLDSPAIASDLSSTAFGLLCLRKYGTNQEVPEHAPGKFQSRNIQGTQSTTPSVLLD